MKKIILIIIFLSISICAYSEQTANIHKTNIPPKIDGFLDDECYKNCAVLSSFLSLSDSAIGENKDKVFLTYDNSNLYIGIDTVCPNMTITHKNKIKASVWEDDDIEIFIRPTFDTKDYYLFGLNGGNSFYIGHQKVSAWFNEVTYKSVPTDKGWCGEISIPFDIFGISTPKEMGFNVAGAKVRSGNLFSWADLFGSTFHNPERFGKITFNESLPVARIDQINLEDKTLNINGQIFGDNSSQYDLTLKEDKRSNILKKEIDIKETFNDPVGTFSLRLKKDNQIFYESNFFASSAKLICSLKGNTLKVKTDFTNTLYDYGTKVGLSIMEPQKENLKNNYIYFGENITYIKPFEKEFEYKLPHKGKYHVLCQVWSFFGLMKTLEEEIIY